jgi:hypothetical protein
MRFRSSCLAKNVATFTSGMRGSAGRSTRQSPIPFVEGGLQIPGNREIRTYVKKIGLPGPSANGIGLKPELQQRLAVSIGLRWSSGLSRSVLNLKTG